MKIPVAIIESDASIDMKTVSVNETELAVEVCGQGSPLLLIHGFPLEHSMWRHQIDHFSQKYQVIAPDMRGFGRSKPVNSHATSMRQMADDCAALLDKLDVIQPVTLCGLSMGGYVAWEFFSRHRYQLEKLILCDTRAGADDPETARARNVMAEHVLAQGMSALAESMLDRILAPDAAIELVNQLRANILDNDPRSVAAAMRGMANRNDASDLLAKIDVPTLLICGSDDAISTPEEMRGIANRIPGAQFALIDGVGHMAPVESPDDSNQVIEKFIEGI